MFAVAAVAAVAVVAAVATVALVAVVAGWVGMAQAGARAPTASCRSHRVRDDRRRTSPRARARRIRRSAASRRPPDRVAVSRLGRLPESGILAAGIRMVGTVPAGGRVYLVPSLHLLAAPMRPVRCVPSAQRARQASLLATLRHGYARRGLCVVIVYRRAAVDDCGATPGTVAALLHGPGRRHFGVVPDGIDSVTLSFRGPRHPARLAFVHGNFWLARSTAGPAPTACGLDWLARDQTVLRTVRRCTPDRS